MVTGWNDVLKQLRKIAAVEKAEQLSDWQIVERFVAEGDEAAFAALVQRHGALVLNVCWRVLQHDADADDACQATFLVLARKASSIRKKDSVASWLHGVAFRVANNLRKETLRRLARERQAATGKSNPQSEVTWREAQTILDEEIQRLPENLKSPVLLCYLEGKAHQEGAQQLGWSLTTFRGRLERAREVLRKRLTQRGVTLSGAFLATVLSEKTASAAVSGSLAAVLVGGALASETAKVVVSAQVLSLARGVMQTMFWNKLKIAAAAFLVAAVAIGLGGLGLHGLTGTEQKQVSAKAEVKKEPAGQNRLPTPQAEGKPVEKHEPIPVAVVQGPPQPPAKFQVKRRTKTTAEELRQQLLLATEVSLDAVPKTSETLILAALTRGNEGKDLLPLLARQRDDLFGLPLKMGHACRTSKEAAEQLQDLSRRLRGHLEAPWPLFLRFLLLNDLERNSWLQTEAIPTLQQLLVAENKSVRLVLVEVLAQIQGREATQALARRALMDLDAEVREAALVALKDRPRADYEQQFLAGFRYPWAAIADHAAEGVVALGLRELAPKLLPLLDLPEPSAPFRITLSNQKTVLVTREVVRINHRSNCLLCHAPSFNSTDLVQGMVPSPGDSPSPYYQSNSGTFVRADITYLKQDFSVSQPVQNSGNRPNHQRFDYLVRLRPLTQEHLIAYQRKNPEANPLYPQKEALLFALRELTGQDRGQTAADWSKEPLFPFSKVPRPREDRER